MKIWIVCPYGPIPGEGWTEYRYTVLGEILAQRGHEVIWWTANFSHHFKKFRSNNWKDITVSNNFEIRLVPTISYSRNVSFRRIWYEILFSIRMYNRATIELAPDFIITAAPNSTCNPFLTRLSKKLKIPLILDFLDLYPEIFSIALPKFARFLAPIVFAPLYWLRTRDFYQATAITSVCDSYSDIARAIVPHFKNNRFLTAFIGINVPSFRAKMANEQEAIQLKVSMDKQATDIWAIYAGSLGNNYDIDALLEASTILQKRKSRVTIKIAGEGPLRAHIQDFVSSRQPTHLNFLGKIEISDLIKLYTICDIALSIYVDGSTVSMPVKVYDYLSAGLPIINSLNGDLGALVVQSNIGLQYQAGNAESLADALDKLALNEGQRELMAQNSYNIAMKFNQAEQYNNLANFIEYFGTTSAPTSSSSC